MIGKVEVKKNKEKTHEKAIKYLMLLGHIKRLTPSLLWIIIKARNNSALEKRL